MVVILINMKVMKDKSSFTSFRTSLRFAAQNDKGLSIRPRAAGCATDYEKL
jgi:hypothetical protein